MSVACGIVGLPNVGKSTLFNAITQAGAEAANYPFCTIEPNVGIVAVPDERLAVINGFIETEKVIPSSLQVVDIAGLVAGASRGEGLGNKFLAHIREVSAILHVVRCFEDGNVVHVSDKVDPVGDVGVIDLELIMADLDSVQRALEKTAKRARGPDPEAKADQPVFEAMVAWLESGKPARAGDWTAAQQARLSRLQLITAKPVLFVANVSQDDLHGQSPLVTALFAHAAAQDAGALALCADLEGELASMDAADRAEFLADLDLPRAGLDRLAQEAYKLLGLQSFYTAGPKEIRAWTIRAGATAPQAAGVIHTDFEKAFIRAEVYGVDDLVACQSEQAIRAAGKMRSEGRDYVMRDADVTHFLVGK